MRHFITLRAGPYFYLFLDFYITSSLTIQSLVRSICYRTFRPIKGHIREGVLLYFFVLQRYRHKHLPIDSERRIQWKASQQEKLLLHFDQQLHTRQRAKHKEDRHVKTAVCEPFSKGLGLFKGHGRAERGRGGAPEVLLSASFS